MKNILMIPMLFCIAYAQDSTKIKSIQLQARLLEYLIPQIFQPANDSLFQVYQDLRPKFRIQSPPSGTTLVTIDSIPTTELATLYNYTLSQADGLGVSSIMKTQIATARSGNSYLDRLCTGYETFWSQVLTTMRLSGRRLLIGR